MCHLSLSNRFNAQADADDELNFSAGDHVEVQTEASLSL